MPRAENRETYQALYQIFNDAYEALCPVYKSLHTWSKTQGGKQQ